MSKRALLLCVSAFCLAACLVWWYYPRNIEVTVNPIATPTIKITPKPSVTPTPTQIPTPTPGLLEEITFTPNEFIEYFYDKALANTSLLTVSPSIYAKAEIDAYIQNLAEVRGYRLQRIAQGGVVAYQGQMIQSAIIADWEALVKEAATEGYQLRIVSGYRNVDTQKSLFTTRFNQASITQKGRMYTDAEILAGAADLTIDSVLKTSSIPGYSKHHSGYVIDINDTSTGQDFTLFSDSEAYQWLKADNYYQAKRFGFLPSYPDGGQNMGPDPEAWELVWVGRSI